MSKKKLFICISIIMTVFLGFFVYKMWNKNSAFYREKDGIKYICKVDNKNFYIYEKGKWQKEFIKGVNIGAAKPGAFPGELAITKEEYLRWFKYIGEMNANSIRVYTILKPEFYEALYEYNKSSDKPIYLFQGVWIDEDNIAKIKNAQDPRIKEAFKEDIKSLIDIIHGNKVLPEKAGHASGTYNKDVSSYVIGWILGIEWHPEFVENTDKINTGNTKYDGKYLYTKEASPFETFLCEVGDFTIDYENENYKVQRPLSYTNWITADMLSHPNEPLVQEDKVTVNTEHIKYKDSFKSGLFASYHIYPYYPDFINYQKDYSKFKDKDGKINTYKAYLRNLRKEHSIPVLVAEFGLPSSRGKAHEDIHSGFNQGNISEKFQGEADAHMLKDIYEEGYAGGLVFSWQDEWFKRTWNTMDLDIPDRRPYWSNAQTNEQEFGLLAFEPGKDKSICYVDGEIGEWKDSKPVYTEKNLKLFMKCDEKYMYFMINTNSFNKDKDQVVIPIDTLPNQGNLNYKELNFKNGAEFLIIINGESNSKILVDSYYDPYYYIYAKKLNMIESKEEYEIKNSGIFNPIYLCLNRELYLPQDKVKLPISKYETGKLTYGNGNPKSLDYNSLADFYIKDNNIEIRIPWQVLNIMDPSTKMAANNFYAVGISPVKIEGIYAGAIMKGKEQTKKNIEMNFYNWKQWEVPEYHERLKPSYYILKEAFKKY